MRVILLSELYCLKIGTQSPLYLSNIELDRAKLCHQWKGDFGNCLGTPKTEKLPLRYSTSENNPNTKLKRRKSFITEFGAEIKYKPGHQNVVADALSRHQINFKADDSTIHSVESSPVERIKRVPFALNRFKNQIEISQSNHNSLESKTTFPGFQNHNVLFSNSKELIRNLEECVSNRHLNAIFATEETFYLIKDPISNAFPHSKFVFTTAKVRDVTGTNDQSAIRQDS